MFTFHFVGIDLERFHHLLVTNLKQKENHFSQTPLLNPEMPNTDEPVQQFARHLVRIQFLKLLLLLFYTLITINLSLLLFLPTEKKYPND